MLLRKIGRLTYIFQSFVPFARISLGLLPCTLTIFGSLSSAVNIMKELFRDTVTGHFLRIISGGKILPFEEDRDPSIWKKYVHVEKSGHMAHHGTLEPEAEDEEKMADGESINDNTRAGEIEEGLFTRDRGPETSSSRDSSGYVLLQSRCLMLAVSRVVEYFQQYDNSCDKPSMPQANRPDNC